MQAKTATSKYRNKVEWKKVGVAKLTNKTLKIQVRPDSATCIFQHPLTFFIFKTQLEELQKGKRNLADVMEKQEVEDDWELHQQA